MKNDFEHPIAIYYDADGKRHEISADLLSDNIQNAMTTAIGMAEKGRLMDWTSTHQLSVRTKSATTRAHFFAKNGSPAIPLYSGERNPAHDNHVQNLLRRISKHAVWSWAGTEYSFPQYRWAIEVVRVLSPTVAARHDLYGQSSELHMSPKRPTVAIEVINTHYPEECVFQALVMLSSLQPVVVFFDVVERGHKFFTVKEADRTLLPRFTIQNGAVWDYNRKTKISNSRDLKAEIENVRG